MTRGCPFGKRPGKNYGQMGPGTQLIGLVISRLKLKNEIVVRIRDDDDIIRRTKFRDERVIK